jgi:translation initiation factor IF-3
VDPGPRANYRIRIPQARVIGVDGEQLGVMATRDAQKIADQEGLDLVEISPNAHPPVCRIMDLGKFKYEQAKSERKARKKQTSTLKEMRYRPKIDKHDIAFKTKHVHAFLEAGHKVKVYVEFRGREVTHTEFGIRILSRVEELLKGVGVPETRPRMEGRHMTMLFIPDKTGGTKDEVKAKPAKPPVAKPTETAANPTVSDGDSAAS